MILKQSHRQPMAINTEVWCIRSIICILFDATALLCMRVRQCQGLLLTFLDSLYIPPVAIVESSVTLLLRNKLWCMFSLSRGRLILSRSWVWLW